MRKLSFAIVIVFLLSVLLGTSVFAAPETLPADTLPLQNSVFTITNPNAQTGTLLPLDVIEEAVAEDPNRLVVVDEAYIDFGAAAESAIPLTERYDNVIVVRTFSKSRSLAGARVGFSVAAPSLTEDLNKVRNSFNP